jgi:hypothetical protein
MAKSRAARRSGCLAIAAMLVAGPPPLQGQAATPSSFAALRSDSAAWQRVLVYVVQRLGPELARAAMDTAAQPWDLQLPPAEPQRQLLERQLRTILRARSLTPTDSVTHRLELGELHIINDTGVVRVQLNEMRRCPGSTRTTGFGWVDTVRVPRDPVQKFWGAARSRMSLVGDRVGC